MRLFLVIGSLLQWFVNAFEAICGYLQSFEVICDYLQSFVIAVFFCSHLRSRFFAVIWGMKADPILSFRKLLSPENFSSLLDCGGPRVDLTLSLRWTYWKCWKSFLRYQPPLPLLPTISDQGAIFFHNLHYKRVENYSSDNKNMEGYSGSKTTQKSAHALL